MARAVDRDVDEVGCADGDVANTIHTDGCIFDVELFKVDAEIKT